MNNGSWEWWRWVLLKKGTASGSSSGAHNGLIVMMMVERIGVKRAIKC